MADLVFSWGYRTRKQGDVFQEHDPGDEGRGGRHLEARPPVPAAVGPAGGGGGAGGGGAAGLLLGGAAPGAAAGGAGEGRGLGAAVAAPPGRGGLRGGLPELEGRRQGDRARPGGVREAHLPHLCQAGETPPAHPESLFFL